MHAAAGVAVTGSAVRRAEQQAHANDIAASSSVDRARVYQRARAPHQLHAALARVVGRADARDDDDRGGEEAEEADGDDDGAWEASHRQQQQQPPLHAHATPASSLRGSVAGGAPPASSTPASSLQQPAQRAHAAGATGSASPAAASAAASAVASAAAAAAAAAATSVVLSPVQLLLREVQAIQKRLAAVESGQLRLGNELSSTRMDAAEMQLKLAASERVAAEMPAAFSTASVSSSGPGGAASRGSAVRMPAEDVPSPSSPAHRHHHHSPPQQQQQHHHHAQGQLHARHSAHHAGASPHADETMTSSSPLAQVPGLLLSLHPSTQSDIATAIAGLLRAQRMRPQFVLAVLQLLQHAGTDAACGGVLGAIEHVLRQHGVNVDVRRASGARRLSAHSGPAGFDSTYGSTEQLRAGPPFSVTNTLGVASSLLPDSESFSSGAADEDSDAGLRGASLSGSALRTGALDGSGGRNAGPIRRAVAEDDDGSGSLDDDDDDDEDEAAGAGGSGGGAGRYAGRRVDQDGGERLGEGAPGAGTGTRSKRGASSAAAKGQARGHSHAHTHAHAHSHAHGHAHLSRPGAGVPRTNGASEGAPVSPQRGANGARYVSSQVAHRGPAPVAEQGLAQQQQQQQQQQQRARAVLHLPTVTMTGDSDGPGAQSDSDGVTIRARFDGYDAGLVAEAQQLAQVFDGGVQATQQRHAVAGALRSSGSLSSAHQGATGGLQQQHSGGGASPVARGTLPSSGQMSAASAGGASFQELQVAASRVVRTGSMGSAGAVANGDSHGGIGAGVGPGVGGSGSGFDVAGRPLMVRAVVTKVDEPLAAPTREQWPDTDAFDDDDTVESGEPVASSAAGHVPSAHGPVATVSASAVASGAREPPMSQHRAADGHVRGYDLGGSSSGGGGSAGAPARSAHIPLAQAMREWYGNGGRAGDGGASGGSTRSSDGGAGEGVQTLAGMYDAGLADAGDMSADVGAGGSHTDAVTPFVTLDDLPAGFKADGIVVASYRAALPLSAGSAAQQPAVPSRAAAGEAELRQQRAATAVVVQPAGWVAGRGARPDPLSLSDGLVDDGVLAPSEYEQQGARTAPPMAAAEVASQRTPPAPAQPATAPQPGSRDAPPPAPAPAPVGARELLLRMLTNSFERELGRCDDDADAVVLALRATLPSTRTPVNRPLFSSGSSVPV